MNDLELLRNCRNQEDGADNIVQYYGFCNLEEEMWILMERMTTCFDQLLKRMRINKQSIPELIVGKVAVAVSGGA